MAKRNTNIYDFDHTVYRGDASIDFIVYCMMRTPMLWKYLPRQTLALAHYIFGSWTRERVKQEIFVFLQDIQDINPTLESFWNKHEKGIARWYIAAHKKTDIIISASPEFLLKPIVQRLGISTLIATKMDPSTGKIMGKNCRGGEKLRRLQQYDASLTIDSFYSDSLSDMPLFQLAQHPFVVKGNAIVPLSQYKPPKLQTINDPAFLRFLTVGGVNACLGILFSYVIFLLIPSPLLAYALGYLISLVISYFLNAVITFKEARFSIKQFWSFCVSYIPNFAIVFGIVYILTNTLRLYPLLAYIIAAAVAAPVTFLLLSRFIFTRKIPR